MLSKFRAGKLLAILLSLKHSASGTNLQCANHVLLLHPPGRNRADMQAVETQAIGRTVRIGQTRRVVVTRFILNDTIEQRMQQRLLAEEGGQRVGAQAEVEEPLPSLSPSHASNASSSNSNSHNSSSVASPSSTALGSAPATGAVEAGAVADAVVIQDDSMEAFPSSAASGSAPAARVAEAVQSLLAMGFPEDRALQAAQDADGDIQAALDRLL